MSHYYSSWKKILIRGAEWTFIPCMAREMSTFGLVTSFNSCWVGGVFEPRKLNFTDCARLNFHSYVYFSSRRFWWSKQGRSASIVNSGRGKLLSPFGGLGNTVDTPVLLYFSYFCTIQKSACAIVVSIRRIFMRLSSIVTIQVLICLTCSSSYVTIL